MSNSPDPYDLSISDQKARIQEFIDRYRNDSSYDGFEKLVMDNIKVVSARRTDMEQDGMEAYCVFEMEVLQGLCSALGRMHGGAVALLADMATSMSTAPVSQKGWWEFGGVSRTLNVTYLKPLPKGAIIVVECMVRNVGSRLSVIQCLMKDKKTGKLLALAEHGKAAYKPSGSLNGSDELQASYLKT